MIEKLRPEVHQLAFDVFAESLLQSSYMNWSKAQIQECLTLYQIWALFDQGQIKSALCVRPMDQNWEILWVQTRSDFLKAGCATQLIRHWLDNASHSAAEVWLEVHELNLVALRLYEKLDFAKHSFRKNYYLDGAGAHVMSRHLGSQKRLS